ncbi:MAG TPA: TerC family protein [Luteibaculaceae bacterium]|nr:TerC family protein [Luteibaculaceae bacterium]
MEILLQPENWVALLTLTFLEIVLGIDNIIFISLVAQKLPAEKQRVARNLGLSMALVFRILLLMSISFIIQLKEPFMEIFSRGISGRDVILFAGGVFLIAKSTSEIHHKVTSFGEKESKEQKKKGKFWPAVVQIVLLDIIFSIDSILTAIGLSDQVLLMIMAVIISLIIMMVFAGAVGDLINKYPTLQILALSFLILIGFTLVLEVEAFPFHAHIEKGFIYFAVFFSLSVEMLNITMRKRSNQK